MTAAQEYRLALWLGGVMAILFGGASLKFYSDIWIMFAFVAAWCIGFGSLSEIRIVAIRKWLRDQND